MTQSATFPALPSAWIAKLLSRFRSIYGSRVEQVYGAADDADFIATWSEELAPYGGADIRSAIDQLRAAHPDYPPTLFQFANLCRDAKRARESAAPRLDYDPRGPIAPEVAQAIGKAFDAANRPNPRAWATKILERVAAGTEPRPPLYAVQCAKEVVEIRT